MRRIEKEMIASVLDNAQVICSTNIGSGHRLLEGRRFPIVLMDEATQAVEPSALIPISKGCRQLILVGDHKQLPPTVISKKAEQGGLGVPCLNDSSMLAFRHIYSTFSTECTPYCGSFRVLDSTMTG